MNNSEIWIWDILRYQMESLLNKINIVQTDILVDFTPIVRGILEYDRDCSFKGDIVNITYKDIQEGYIIDNVSYDIQAGYSSWDDSPKARRDDILAADTLEVIARTYTGGKEYVFGESPIEGYRDISLDISVHPFIPHNKEETGLTLRIDLMHPINVQTKHKRALTHYPYCLKGYMYHEGKLKEVSKIQAFPCLCNAYLPKKSICKHIIYIYFSDGSHIMYFGGGLPFTVDELKMKGYIPYIHLYLSEKEENDKDCDLYKIIPSDRRAPYSW